ncbi:MAG: prepilin-type N-terminal cleavage/methylation domain-containing protein [Planctomycetota bacterium]|nr:prepilin-type N-terminal cleavage/methylation domain-containing protein [Planctomycetota bacterium]
MTLRRSLNRGFTLIEILIVVAIIALLAALLVVGVVGMRRRAQFEKTRALIQRIEVGLKVYYERYIQYPPPAHPAVPPVSPFLGLGVNNSGPMLWYLGTPQPCLSGGTWGTMSPCVDFQTSEVEPLVAGGTGNNAPINTGMVRPIVDAWGRRISYRRPGANHATVVNPGVHDRGKDHSKYIDLWSWGADGGSRGPLGTGSVNTIMYTQAGAGGESGVYPNGYPNSGYGIDDIANWYAK